MSRNIWKKVFFAAVWILTVATGFIYNRSWKKGALFVWRPLRGGTYEVPVRTLLNITARQLSVWGGSIALLEEDLQAMQSSGLTCIVLGKQKKTASNIAADLKEKGLSVVYMPDLSEIPDKGIIITKGALSAGMEFPAAGFGIITHGRHTGKAAAKKRKTNMHKNCTALQN